MTDRKPVFIEKIMPVKLLNEQVYYENGGNPFKGLHRWYSRKPLSFSRASVLGSLLPADISMEEFEYLLGLDRARANENEAEKNDRHQRTRLYKTPPSPERVKRVQELCEQMWGDKTPAVLDAFAGGGSIPFEAARYGLRVFASDLNPVAVVTMKAAIAFPLQFGAALQEDIDKWVKWVGDEAERRLSEFFPSQDGEKVQNYLWAHTVVCPSCQSVVPLSPNWWLYKRPEKQNLSKWFAVKPIPNLAEKRVDFELVKGKKSGDKGILVGQASSLSNPQNQSPNQSNSSEKDSNSSGKDSSSLDKGNVGQDARPTGIYNPDDFTTVARGVGKCPNCDSVIEDQVVKNQAQNGGLGHQLYAVAFKRGQGSLEFRTPLETDLQAIDKAQEKLDFYHENRVVKDFATIPLGQETTRLSAQGIYQWDHLFNPRQLLTLVTYVEIINEAKVKIREELGEEKLQAIATYLAMVLDRCVDRQCRLARWHPSRSTVEGCSAQHALNLMWNYPETSGNGELWHSCADVFASDYEKLCEILGTKNNSSSFQELENHTEKTFQIDSASADSLFHLADRSIDAVVTDPPYYSTIQYAELSDFFYCLYPDTLIITKRGYISISDVTTDDFVLDLDGKWTAVQKIGFRDYNDHIFEIQTAYNGQKLIITSGHKVWTLKKERAGELTGEWIDSSQLKKGDYVFLPTLNTTNKQNSYTLSLNDYIDYFVDEDWLYYGKKSQEIIAIQQEIQKLGTEYKTLKEIAAKLNVSYQRVVRINGEQKYDHFRIRNKIEIDYNLMKVFGYFLAEGSILKRQSKRQEGRLSFVFHEKEEHYVNEILETMWEKFSCQGRIQRREKEKAIILNFYCEPLADFFGKTLGENSTEKKVADWILELPQELLSGLLEGYWNGDGSKGKEFFQTTTVSKDLACKIRLILQQHGIVSHLYVDNQTRKAYFHNREVISQPRFLIKVWGKYREKLANILNIKTPKVKQGNYLNLWTSEGQWLPIRNIKISSYTGKVYNLTTESHNYVTAQCCVHNCWQKRILGDIFPELYYTELTDKDREAVANPSRIVAGFEITASWAVSTENPQNLHQAQKNSVSSTVLLICRQRDRNAGQAWWDDLRPEVANLVEQRAPEFEANEIQGIDLYLSAFDPALNVFSRNYPILDSTGVEVRPEVAFAEARKALANYRFRKLAQTDTAGFDPLTQWYFLAWDAFQAREFPFDDARQLALAVGGFNVADLGKTYKLLDIKSGTCKLLSPEQRYKKHAFSLVDNEFSARYLIDGLHAITAIYLEEQTIEPVRRFMKATGLLSNEMFMRSWEVALRVIPHISDPRKRIPEEKALADLWLAMDEIKAKVSYEQREISFTTGQMGLDFDNAEEDP